MILTDLTGSTFGRLQVIDRAADRGNRKVYWLCRCECGQSTETMGDSLKKGLTKSCGCLRKEGRSTHGGADLAEYDVWCKMKARCLNPHDEAYKNYGERGITVCDRWKDDFSAFLSDMGRRPESHLTIERVDNDKGYSPDNCIWATRAVQNRNQRPRKRKTHCKRGHPRSGDSPCLACRKILWKLWSATHRRSA
jgi:hypothetical protein